MSIENEKTKALLRNEDVFAVPCYIKSITTESKHMDLMDGGGSMACNITLVCFPITADEMKELQRLCSAAAQSTAIVEKNSVFFLKRVR
jgi:hypothetical protein